MIRLLVHVEGETEETFVNEILRSHLARSASLAVSARIVGNSRLRHRRGGIRGWDSVRKDIIRHLTEDRQALATTMVDYYALPANGTGAWPGRFKASSTAGFLQKASLVEAALSFDIQKELGDSFDHRRFIPYVVMHEFEGLLFSDCAAFGKGIGRTDLAAKFQEIRDGFASPEEINDSPITAPSKRVEALMPSYEKPLLGTLAALEIGLEKMRSECQHLAAWLHKLEQIGQPAK